MLSGVVVYGGETITPMIYKKNDFIITELIKIEYDWNNKHLCCIFVEFQATLDFLFQFSI